MWIDPIFDLIYPPPPPAPRPAAAQYTIGGSGSTYIYGFCDRMFKPGMNKEECITFVRTALSHAMARDGSSGGVIRTVCITKDGVDRTFTAGDKLPYHAEGDVQIVDKEAGLN